MKAMTHMENKPVFTTLLRRIGVVTLLLSVMCHASAGIAAESARTNVILIMTDDQGYGDLACHGNPVVRTPHLDRLATQGVSFTNFHVDTYCTPTRSALMTGRYSHRVGGWGTVAGRNMLRDGEVTMADVFRHNGYRTGIFGKWHLGTNYPYRPIDRGFDEWLGKGDGGTGCTTDHWGNDRVNDVFIHNGNKVALSGFETDVFFEAAMKFIRTNKEHPFFIYLTPYAVHSPESIPDPKWLIPYTGKVSPAVADFYATISNIDQNVGRLREFLRTEGLEENTILVFLTDNGSAQNPFSAGMRGKKGSQYEGGHRVPCFFYWPAGGLRPQRVDRLTAHLDLLPTFVDLCSLEMPKPVRFDGVSLRPLLTDSQTAWSDRALIVGSVYNGVPLPRPKWDKTSVMRGTWRLVDSKELYDLSSDPGQERNIAAAQPEVVARLMADYEAYWNDVTPQVRDWVETLGRPILGAAAQPELYLCAEDWVCDSLGSCPWNQASVATGATSFGTWRIRVQTPGAYCVDVRRWPREVEAPMAGVPAVVMGEPDAWLRSKPVANLLYGGQPKAMPVACVSLTIAGKTQKCSITPEDRSAVFQVELPAGETTVEARLLDVSGTELAGAYYAYIRPASLSSRAGSVEGPANLPRKYEYTWDSLKGHPVPQWFDDAKFGIFIHWGPQSLWNGPWASYQNPAKSYPSLRKQFGAAPPEFGYKDVVPMFKAEKWDPEAWADLFQKAGARYVILTGEHHDGYMLGDSDLTGWCAAKIGPRRDIIADLGQAVRARGMKYAPSYHRERHAGMFSQKKFLEKSPPCKDIAEEIRLNPEAEDLYGPFEYSDAFIADYVGRWKELERKYQPDFMWIDDIPFFYNDPTSPQVVRYRDACLRMICDYLNTAQQWGKEVYLNNKGRQPNWPDGVGCYEKDRLNVDEVAKVKWQCPMTMGHTWFYNPAEDATDSYKTPTELIHLLCDITSKNGSLLLNVGPRPDGTIPEGMQERLLAIGKWLAANGEAIYGTRPWKVFGEGNGEANKPARPYTVPIRPTEIRYTQKGDALYAISLAKPAKPLLLRAARDWNVGAVTLLGSMEGVVWTMTDTGLRLEPPTTAAGEHAWVFKIESSRNNAGAE